MTFAHPYILLALLLLPLIALLYVRRAGRREAVVPSLLLWKTVATEAAAETGKRLGSFDLPLLFALLFLAAAILAASEPAMVARTETAPHVLVIADRSASMASNTGSGKTRWEKSVEDVAGLLDRLGSGKVTLIGLPLAAGPGLKELAPAEAKAELRKLSPTDMPLDIAKELSRCAGIARNASAVVVMTDNAALVPEGLGGKRVLVISHGAASRNVAIDGLEISRDANGKLFAFSTVKNYSQAATEVTVIVAESATLSALGRPTDDSTVTMKTTLQLAAGQTGRLLRPLAMGKVKSVAVRLEVDDDLPADNDAITVQADMDELRVAYVGRGNQFILRALGPLPSVAVSHFRLTSDVKGGFDLYVFDGVVPDELPAGDVVLIDPEGKVGPFRVRGAATDESGMRASKMKDLPILEHIDVGALRFRRALNVVMPGGAQEVISIPGVEATAMVRWENKSSRVTLIGCALVPSETNWPMLPSFPIFWANVVQDVAGRRALADDVPTYSLTGEHIVLRQVGNAELSVAGPNGEAIRLIPGRGARASFLPMKAGVYSVTGGRARRHYAVNMLHPSESNNAGIPSEPSVSLEKSILAPAVVAGVSLWRHLATAALVFALAYWATTARRGR